MDFSVNSWKEWQKAEIESVFIIIIIYLFVNFILTPKRLVYFKNILYSFVSVILFSTVYKQ